MKKLRKGILLLTVLTVLLLTGCGSSGEKKNGEVTAEPSAAPENADTETTEPAEDDRDPFDMDEIGDDISENTGSEGTDIFSGSGLEEAFRVWKISELGITADSERVSVLEQEDGSVRLSGSAEAFAGTVFTLNTEFDFGTSAADRLEMDLAASCDGVTAELFLDDSTEKAASESVPTGNTASSGESNPTVQSLKAVTGKHTVHFIFRTEENTSGNIEIVLRTLEFVESGVPVLYFNIDEALGTIEAMNSDEEHKTECYGSVTVYVPEGYASPYGIDDSYEGGIYELSYLRGRGNTSWSYYDKKPYKMKLQDKADIFGMGESRHWVLVAGAKDVSMLHNAYTSKLAELTGLPYELQGVHVDVYLNGEYYGNYYLCEQVMVASDRVEIDNLEWDYEESEPTGLALTGGYLIAGPNNSKSDSGFYSVFTEQGSEFTIVSPENYEGFSYTAADSYIEAYLQRVENAIYGLPTDGVVENVWDLMDLDSTIRYFLIQMFSYNTDAYRTSSTYLYKERDTVDADGNVVTGKLYWGPLWDFDLAWSQGAEDYPPDGWDITNRWINALLKYQPEFKEGIVAYWPEFYEKLMEIAGDGGYIDSMAELMLSSAVRNYLINPIEEDLAPFEGQGLTVRDYYLKVLESEKYWITERAGWFTDSISYIRSGMVKVTYVSEGKTVYEAEEVELSMLKLLPEDPVSSDPELTFAGWSYSYTAYNDEGEEEIRTELVDDCFLLDSEFLTDTDGNYEITLTAVFE